MMTGAGAVWLIRGTAPAQEAPLQSVPLTTYSGDEYFPSSSPDGNQFAFEWNGERNDNTDIYVRLVAPSAPMRPTTDSAPDLNPD